MRHYSHFNRIVINPIKRYGNRGSGRGAMRTLRKQVVKGVLQAEESSEQQGPPEGEREEGGGRARPHARQSTHLRDPGR